MLSDFSLGPRYLHKTKNTEKLLKDLDIEIKNRIIRVGYIGDTGWIEQPSVHFRRKYFMKSRQKKDLVDFDETSMNSNKKEFEVFDVDFNLLIHKLNKVVGDRIYFGNIQSINLTDKKINMLDYRAEKYIYTYDKLISTIPLKYFIMSVEENIKEKKEIYESYDMTYVLVKKESLIDNKQFDFVYDIRDDIYSHRITKDDSNSDNVILDCFGSLNTSFLKNKFNNYINHKVLKNSQIISKSSIPQIENVTFIGRYGTWNREWKTEKVVDESIKNLES